MNLSQGLVSSLVFGSTRRDLSRSSLWLSCCNSLSNAAFCKDGSILSDKIFNASHEYTTRHYISCRARCETPWDNHCPIFGSPRFVPALQMSLNNISSTLWMVFSGGGFVRRSSSASHASVTGPDLQPFNRSHPFLRILQAIPILCKGMPVMLERLKDFSIYLGRIMMMPCEVERNSRGGKGGLTL